MLISPLLSRLPLAGVFGVTIVLVLAAIVVGSWLGRRRSATGEGEAAVGAVVGASLGLLAFLLTFTFSMALGRFDARKAALLDEVNAIGTAYLRAGLLPAPHAEQIRELLREYVGVRIEAARNPENLAAAIRRSEALHGELWAHAEVLAAADSGSRMTALFVESLNEVIDLHTTRVTVATLYRIPDAIWDAIFGVALLAMAAAGYHFSRAGGVSLWLRLVLGITFSLVIGLIADLDRPGEGQLRVDQQPMLDLQQAFQRDVR